MSRIKCTLEMRGMPREELIKYFIAMGGKSIGNGIFVDLNWEVHVHSQISCTLGALAIPSTQVSFCIEEEYYTEMISKFRLNFLCAGG